MTGLMKRMGVALAAAVVAVVAITAVVRAAPAAAAEIQAGVLAPVGHRGGGRGGYYTEAGRAAAAEMLGMTVDELTAQLQAGESLADLAEAAGVDLQDLLDAVNAANVEATREAIAEAVTEGTLTQDKADWLNEGLDNGYWGPGAAGSLGFGPRGIGFGGHGPNPLDESAPATATPGSDS
jgi:hypothetical protein